MAKKLSKKKIKCVPCRKVGKAIKTKAVAGHRKVKAARKKVIKTIKRHPKKAAAVGAGIAVAAAAGVAAAVLTRKKKGKISSKKKSKKKK
ncbi:hypothetical protein KY345_06900 [Candidatus Woesearchaeota archaeon]|nr:hypothetical protein [Candidatus Woesearchaeota archaeon]